MLRWSESDALRNEVLVWCGSLYGNPYWRQRLTELVQRLLREKDVSDEARLGFDYYEKRAREVELTTWEEFVRGLTGRS